MRARAGTWLVAAAVVVLATAAAVDAVLSGRSDASAPPPSPREARSDTTTGEIRDAFLDEERIVGRLLYVEEGCRVRTVDLPEAERRAEPGRLACGFTSSPGGIVGVDGAVLSPRPGPRLSELQLAARCVEGRVELRALTGEGADAQSLGPVLQRVPGCAPAWRPDGTLTVVRDGEVVGLGLDPHRPPRTVLSRADLARAFGRDPWNLERPIAREVAWLDDDLLAVVVRAAGGAGDLLALFRAGRLVANTPSPYDRLSGIRASPNGTYVAARISDASALVLLDRSGDFVPVGLRGHAITWSPDEVWAAVASRDAIYVFEAGGRASRFGRIPIRARDVFWR